MPGRLPHASGAGDCDDRSRAIATSPGASRRYPSDLRHSLARMRADGSARNWSPWRPSQRSTSRRRCAAGMPHHDRRNVSRSALTRSFSVEHMPCDAPLILIALTDQGVSSVFEDHVDTPCRVEHVQPCTESDPQLSSLEQELVEQQIDEPAPGVAQCPRVALQRRSVCVGIAALCDGRAKRLAPCHFIDLRLQHPREVAVHLCKVLDIHDHEIAGSF